MSSITDMPSTSYHAIECPALKNPECSHQIGEDLTGDFKYLHAKQKATMSPHLGCHVEQVDRTESGELSKTKLESPLANGIKNVPESSSKAIFADDQRSDRES